ncbi:UNVERIFIED_CONTAM: hypothetical protein FKN15_053317 [Acipenser sinensis]
MPARLPPGFSRNSLLTPVKPGCHPCISTDTIPVPDLTLHALPPMSAAPSAPSPNIAAPIISMPARLPPGFSRNSVLTPVKPGCHPCISTDTIPVPVSHKWHLTLSGPMSDLARHCNYSYPVQYKFNCTCENKLDLTCLTRT